MAPLKKLVKGHSNSDRGSLHVLITLWSRYLEQQEDKWADAFQSISGSPLKKEEQYN